MEQDLIEFEVTTKSKIVVTTDVYCGTRFINLILCKMNDGKKSWERTDNIITISKEQFNLIEDKLKKISYAYKNSI